MVNSGILPFGARQTARYDDSVIRSIPGLKLWFDATKLPVMNDGTSVATWPDMSGNGYDVTQATEANQALYYSNIFNGKPALKFNGSGQYYENAVSNPFTSGAARTVFIHARTYEDVSVFITFRLSTPVWVYMNLNTGTAKGQYFVDGVDSNANTRAIGAAGINAGGTLTIRAPGGGGTHVARFNGTTLANSQGSTPNNDTGTTGFYIGRRELSQYMNGYLSEIIGYNSYLTDAQCLQVEKYLAAKYMTIAQ